MIHVTRVDLINAEPVIDRIRAKIRVGLGVVIRPARRGIPERRILVRVLVLLIRILGVRAPRPRIVLLDKASAAAIVVIPGWLFRDQVRAILALLESIDSLALFQEI